MTSTLVRAGDETPPGTPPASTSADAGARSGVRAFAARHGVLLVALTTVLMRLPHLTDAAGADEGGFLMVARQWHAHGSSLYGDYWVDRPPLLITIFDLAAHAGGLVALRLIGCLAAFLVVLGVARAVRLGTTQLRRTAGSSTGARRLGRAPAWGAVTAAALFVTPLTGSMEVNGELLAAPFVVWGLVAALEAISSQAAQAQAQPQTRTGRQARPWAWAAGCGAALAASLMVKQNMADVGVFAATWGATALLRREIGRRRAWQLALSLLAGAGLVLAVTAVWTVLHGTSLPALYDALYPFRLRAAALSDAANSGSVGVRRTQLLQSWTVGGGALLMLLVLSALLGRRLGGTLRGSVVAGLVATVGFDCLSVAMGGNFWNHYQIQLVAPLAVLGGLAVAAGQRGARTVLAFVAVSALVSWSAALSSGALADGTVVGRAVAAVSRPGDTIVTLYGHADVSGSSGLASPYPQLWSLPTKTLDPQLRTLDSVLAGPRAPTWLVTWGSLSSWGVDSTETSRLVARLYHPAGRVLGHLVYLHDGVHRAAPSATAP